MFLSSCMLTENAAPPVFDLRSASADVTYNDIQSDITITNNAVCTIIGTGGITYTFDEKGVQIALGELSVTSDNSRINSNALPQLICDILKNAASENALLPCSECKDNETEYSGELNGLRYTLTCDRRSGKILKITSKAMDLNIDIYQTLEQ